MEIKYNIYLGWLIKSKYNGMIKVVLSEDVTNCICW